MVNALRVAGDFLARLPRTELTPETTAGREGFLHPYAIEGGVAQATLRVLLRDFETACLDELAERLAEIAAECEHDHPGHASNFRRQVQYRNMCAGLLAEPRAVAYAEEALRQAGTQSRSARSCAAAPTARG